MIHASMRSRQLSRGGHQRRPGGFSLIELMISMLIGLLLTLAIVHTLSFAETFRRGATTGSDAQVTASLGLFSLQRELQQAGYGIASTASVLGCALQAKYAGANVTTLMPSLVPVLITSGGATGFDTIRVLSGTSQVGYAVPSLATPPYYNPNDQSTGGAAFSMNVSSVIGFSSGDLVVLAEPGAATACELFQVSGTPTVGNLPRADDGGWNGNKWPNTVASSGDLAINLGAIRDVLFQVTDGKLQSTQFDSTTRAMTAAQDMESNVVGLRALYAVDTTGTGAIDYRTAAPTAAMWQTQQVRAVRVAILVRSDHYLQARTEDGGLTSDTDPNFYWHLNATAAPNVPDAIDCPTGGGKCIKMKPDPTVMTDWDHYRYKLMETLVPLRNGVWHS